MKHSPLQRKQRKLLRVLCCVCRFGRKKTVLIAYGVKIIGVLLSIFGRNYTVFGIGRYLMGCGTSYYATNFIIGRTHMMFLFFDLMLDISTSVLLKVKDGQYSTHNNREQLGQFMDKKILQS